MRLKLSTGCTITIFFTLLLSNQPNMVSEAKIVPVTVTPPVRTQIKTDSLIVVIYQIDSLMAVNEQGLKTLQNQQLKLQKR